MLVQLSGAGQLYVDKLAGYKERQLHLFDSFMGLPKTTNVVDQESIHVKIGVWAPGNLSGISPKRLKEICRGNISKERINIYEGWFNETLTMIPRHTKFAFVHVDCDLYQSTLDVLDHLFSNEMFSDGCLLAFDDWLCNRASPDFGQQRAWAECLKKYKPKYLDVGSQGVGYSRRHFILHK